MKNILVTGGLGFIGRHLIDELIKPNNCCIDIVDNLSNNSILSSVFDNNKQITVYPCSVKDFVLKEKYDEIYHLASPVGPAGVLKYGGVMGLMILEDSLKIANYAYKNCSKVIFMSTSEVYGKDPSGEKQSEDINKIVPPKITVRLEYGVSKLLSEIAVRNFSLNHPFVYNIIRPFNITGKGQSSNAGFVVPRFINSALGGDNITIFGDGVQRRCFTHVRDIVSSIVMIIGSDVSGEIFNVGNPNNEMSINELALKIKQFTNSNSNIVHVNPKDIYGKHYEEAWNKIPDISKIESLIGWKPKYSFNDLLKEIII